MTQKKKTGTSGVRVARKTLPKVSSRCKKVAVLFAVNNGYAPYLGVALASLVEHAGKHEYEFIVLYRDLNERNRELLEHIVDQFGRESAGSFRLRFMEMPVNLADYDFAPGYKSLSVESWYRLFAPSLFLEYGKILWLDSDILVRDDVAIMASSAFWNVGSGKSSPSWDHILPKCWGSNVRRKITSMRA